MSVCFGGDLRTPSEPEPPTIPQSPVPVAFDFYRCAGMKGCGRLITQPEMQRALAPGGEGRPCPCGNRAFSPTNLRRRDYLRPRVWRFAWQRVRELGYRGVATGIREDVRRWLTPKA